MSASVLERCLVLQHVHNVGAAVAVASFLRHVFFLVLNSGASCVDAPFAGCHVGKGVHARPAGAARGGPGFGSGARTPRRRRCRCEGAEAGAREGWLACGGRRLSDRGRIGLTLLRLVCTLVNYTRGSPRLISASLRCTWYMRGISF